MGAIHRYRNTDDVQERPAYYLTPNDGINHYPTDGYVYATSLGSGTNLERIDDWVEEGFKKTKGRKAPNHPVSHLKIRMNTPMFMHDWVHSGGNDSQINDRWPVSMDPNNVIALMPGPNAGTLSSFADIAFNKLYTQVPTSVSIANFAYELKDWKSLMPSFKRNLKEGVTGNFLNVNFGWKPLIGDVKKLMSLRDDVARRLAFLRASAGKRIRIAVFGEITGPYGPLTLQFGPFPHIQFLYRVESYRGTWSAQGYLTQDLQNLDDATTELRAFSAALGLNNPAKIVWNAIPYSFVVDWVSRIGSLLDRLAVPLFPGEWRIEDVSFSYNEKLTFSVFQSDYSFGPLTRLLGVAEIERYVRQNGLPASSLFLTDLGLDIRQQMLALALIHQRI